MRFRPLLLVAALVGAAGAAGADPLVHPDQFVPDTGSTSPITAAFVAAVGPFNGFLAASDRLAAAHGAAGSRRFAAQEATTRAAVLAALRSWAAGVARARYAESHAPSIDRLGPVFGLANGPVDIVAVPSDLQQRRDLAALDRLDGAAFDALYARAQTATLLQLENTYVDYIKNGDDQVLRALSVRDLPVVRELLGRISRS